ncbi:MAG TPA: polysaccharide deacetylase family protein [Victivallales bacterium]|nr:polysaccharide deacetylase family protein [Victivallales bacterium]
MKCKDAFVLFYHRVLPFDSTLSISEKNFEKHIQYLHNAGFEFMDSKMFDAFFDGKLKENGKYVLLTFDDGWADNLFYATPILKKYSAKAMLAISTSLVNNCEIRRNKETFNIIESQKALEAASYGHDYSQFLSWNELTEMKDSGIWDFASHGSSHFGIYYSLRKIRGFFPKQWHWTMQYALGEKIFEGAPRAEFRSELSTIKKKISPELINLLKNAKSNKERIKICKKFLNPLQEIESQDEFKKRVKNDLEKSCQLILNKLKVNPNSLVWPWGHYSELSEKIAIDVGFKFLFTTDRGKLNSNTNPFRIPRINAPKTLFHLKRRLKHGIFSII